MNRDDLIQFARQSEFANFGGARPRVDRPEELLRHVIRFDFGFGEQAKRAVSRYAKALEPAFKAGISASAIAQHIIDSGGINKMAAANVRTRRVAKPATHAEIVIKAEDGDLAQQVLVLEPGQHAKVGIEMLSRTGRTATVKITRMKRRKSPKRTNRPI